jgi:hypothetical protein
MTQKIEKHKMLREESFYYLKELKEIFLYSILLTIALISIEHAHSTSNHEFFSQIFEFTVAGVNNFLEPSKIGPSTGTLYAILMCFYYPVYRIFSALQINKDYNKIKPESQKMSLAPKFDKISILEKTINKIAEFSAGVRFSISFLISIFFFAYYISDKPEDSDKFLEYFGSTILYIAFINLIWGYAVILPSRYLLPKIKLIIKNR